MRKTTTVIRRVQTAPAIQQYLVQVTMPTGERKTVQVGDHSEREAKEQALDLWGHLQPDLSRYAIVKPQYF